MNLRLSYRSWKTTFLTYFNIIRAGYIPEYTFWWIDTRTYKSVAPAQYIERISTIPQCHTQYGSIANFSQNSLKKYSWVKIFQWEWNIDEIYPIWSLSRKLEVGAQNEFYCLIEFGQTTSIQIGENSNEESLSSNTLREYSQVTIHIVHWRLVPVSRIWSLFSKFYDSGIEEKKFQSF